MLHLAGSQEEISCPIGNILGFGLSSILRTSSIFPCYGDLITFRAIDKRHVCLHLKQAGTISFEAVRVAVSVGETAASANLGTEGILGNRATFHGALIVETRQRYVMIL